MQRKTPKSKVVLKPKDVIRTLGKLQDIASTRNIPLQKKVDLLNSEMLKILKPTAIN